MVWYATREDVKSALDSAETARSNSHVDRAIEAASRAIEALTLRRFYPTTATRYFDWPDRNSSRPWRLWLNQDELISVTTLTVAGETIAPSDYFLEPANSGPPFTRLEIDLSSSASFSSGDTHQRAVAITGVFGYAAATERVGELTAELAADLNASASVSWDTADLGVGDLLKIDDEWVNVSARTMVNTAQTLGVDLAASMSDVTVEVSDGTSFAPNAVLLINSERMLVIDVVEDTLTVKRAWDGSVLAAHTSADPVYTLTGATLQRAQLGTTLAAHTSGDVVYRLVIPGPIRSLCIAEAMNTLLQDDAGWSRGVSSGDSERPAAGADLPGLRADVRKQYGRRSRLGAV